MTRAGRGAIQLAAVDPRINHSAVAAKYAAKGECSHPHRAGDYAGQDGDRRVGGRREAGSYERSSAATRRMSGRG